MGLLSPWTIPFPVYHVPGNHDVVSLTETLPNPYGRSFPNAQAEELFREAFPEIPENGPEGQEGLSYFVEGKDFILIVLHSIYSGRSSTGFNEGEWLERTLEHFKDKPVKLLASHFPVFPVNGYDRHAPYPHASWIINPREGYSAAQGKLLLGIPFPHHHPLVSIYSVGPRFGTWEDTKTAFLSGERNCRYSGNSSPVIEDISLRTSVLAASADIDTL